MEDGGGEKGESEGECEGEGVGSSTSLSVPAHRRRLEESEVGGLAWLLGGGW